MPAFLTLQRRSRFFTKKISLFLLFIFLLTSCNSQTQPPVVPVDPDIPPVDDSKEYEKDEEGFYIVEEDYFMDTSTPDYLKQSKLRYAKSIEASRTYKQMRLYAGDKEIPLYNTKVNTSQFWNATAPQRASNAVGILELEGVMTFKLQCNFAIRNECKISPLNANVLYEVDENRRVITFTITSTGQYTIELRSQRTLHLFVNDYKQYEAYKENDNLIYFGPGVHNASNSSYISSDHYVHLKSNQTVWIDLGAVLECGFIASNCTNFKIVGSGIVYGDCFSRDANTGSRLIPYDFSNCKNFTIEGVTTLDPAGWCYNLYFCQSVWLDNIKIISSRSNGDGISLQSCENVSCKNCFVRSWDDSLVVKNYPVWNSSKQGTTKNILFYNCILWTDLAQSMEIGFETIGSVMENIVFDNIVVIHNFHKAPISIHNGNNAHIKQVKFMNITIEDASMGLGDGSPILIDFSTEFSTTWSTNHGVTALGSIDDVLVKNVLILNGIKNPKISIKGCIDKRAEYKNSLHEITNVTLEDVYLYDTLIDGGYANFDMAYTQNIVFLTTGIKATGATYQSNGAADLYGTYYTIEAV